MHGPESNEAPHEAQHGTDPCAGYTGLRLSVAVAKTPIALQGGAHGGFHVGVMPDAKGTFLTLSPRAGLCPPCAVHQVGLLRGRLSRTLGVAGSNGRGVPHGTPPAPTGHVTRGRWSQYHVFTTCLTGPRGGTPYNDDEGAPSEGCSALHRRMAGLHGGGIAGPSIVEVIGYIAGTAAEVDSPLDFPTVLASSMAQFQQQGGTSPGRIPHRVLALDFSEETFDDLYGPLYGADDESDDETEDETEDGYGA